MKLVLMILAATLIVPAYANADEKLEQKKAEATARIDERMKKMEEHKACIKAAQTAEAKKACRESMKAWRQAEREKRLAERKARLDQKMNKLQEKKAAGQPAAQ